MSVNAQDGLVLICELQFHGNVIQCLFLLLVSNQHRKRNL